MLARTGVVAVTEVPTVAKAGAVIAGGTGLRNAVCVTSLDPVWPPALAATSIAYTPTSAAVNVAVAEPSEGLEIVAVAGPNNCVKENVAEATFTTRPKRAAWR